MKAFLDVFAYRFNHRSHLEDAFFDGLRGLVYGEPWSWGEMRGSGGRSAA